jgi:acyl carrier protein phosphodiesterase
MISDFVKGKKKFNYPPDIQKGIALHRAIDSFTDAHPATKEAKEIFRPHYRLYAGALVDVLYDHFLAIDPAEFDEAALLSFSQQVYDVLQKHQDQMPETFAMFFPLMKQHNWLYNYRTRRGIAKSLGGLVRRAAYLTESDTAFQLFEDNYQHLQDCYRQFWDTVKPFARLEFEKLFSSP